MQKNMIPAPDVLWSTVFEEFIAIQGGNAHPSNPQRLYDRIEDKNGKSHFVPRQKEKIPSHTPAFKREDIARAFRTTYKEGETMTDNRNKG